MNFYQKKLKKLLHEYQGSSILSSPTKAEIKESVLDFLKTDFDYCFLSAKDELRQILLTVFCNDEIFAIYDQYSNRIVFESFVGLFQDAPEFIKRNLAEFVNKRNMTLDFMITIAKINIGSLTEVKDILKLGVDPYEVLNTASFALRKNLEDSNFKNEFINLFLEYDQSEDTINSFI